MQHSVGPHISGIVQALHAEYGVRLHLGSKIKSINATASSSALIVIEARLIGTFEDEALIRPWNSQDGASLRQSVRYLRGYRVAAMVAIEAPEEFIVAKILIKTASKVAPERLADKFLPIQAFLQAA
jgi:hypothetical protein